MSTYTTNIGIEKPGLGEQDGTWGTTLNQDFDLIDKALNDYVSITLAAATSATAPPPAELKSETYLGSLQNGQAAFIAYTDAGGDPFTADSYVQLTPSTAKRIIHFWNNLSGNRSLHLYQGTWGSGTEFVLANGKSATVAFSGEGSGQSIGCRAVLKNPQFTGDAKVNGAIVATGAISGSNLSGTNTGDHAQFAGSAAGLVPTSAGGTTNYLRADGGWAAPAGGGGSPLTQKGDLYTFSTVNAALTVGANGTYLKADSTQPTGLVWASGATGLTAIVQDTTSPTLGNNLSSGGFNINMVNAGTASQINFYENAAGGSHYTGIRAPASLTASTTLHLPSDAPSNGEILQWNTGGLLSWETKPTGSVTAVNKGNGMNFTNFSTTGTITLGTPAEVSATSTNTVGTSDHTHAINANIARTGHNISTHGDVTITSLAGGDLMKWSGTAWVNSTLANANIATATHQHTGVVVTNDNSTSSTLYLMFARASASIQDIYSQTNIYANATNGTLNAVAFNATSARDKKTEVGGWIDPSRLDWFRPIRYTMNDDSTGKVQFGAFADDMANAYPEIVTFDDTGKAIGIDYSRLVIPLLLRVRELEARLEKGGL